MNWKNRIYILTCFILLIGTGEVVKAQETVKEELISKPRVITLDECLKLAQTDNLDLKRMQLNYNLSLLDRIKAGAIFDPSFEVDLSGGQSSQGASSTGSFDGDRENLILKYKLPTDLGGGWLFVIDQARTSGSTEVGSNVVNYTSYSSGCQLGYSMQLLEGSNQRINRLGIEQADLGIHRSEAMIKDASRSLRYGVIQAYFAAVIASKGVEVSSQSLETAKSLVESVKARIDVGQLAPYELLAAKAGLAQREEELLNAKTRLNAALDSLKKLIGMRITDEIAIDSGILNPIALDLDFDDLMIIAQRNRPDYLDIELRKRQAQLVLIAASDSEKPSLSWNTQIGFSGSSDDYGKTFEKLGNFSWSTSLNYQMPLGGNRIDKAAVQAAEINLEQLELEKIDFLRTLQLDLRTAIGEFENAVQRIYVTSQGLEVQEVKMKNEKTRMELGIITSRDLLEFDLELASARLAYASSIADAYVALAKVEFLTNELLLDDVIFISEIKTSNEAAQ